MTGKPELECHYRYAFACRKCHPTGGWHYGSSNKSFEDAQLAARGGNATTCPKHHPSPERFAPFDEKYKVHVVTCPHCGGKHLAGDVWNASKTSAMGSLEFRLNKCKGTVEA